MIEFLFVIYLLILFIFPIPSLWGIITVGTYIFLYKKYLLLKFQPKNGRIIVFLSAITYAFNLFASLALAFILAYLIELWIFDNYYLQAFNIAFVFIVSLRWFDFTYAIYRNYILKQNNLNQVNKPQSNFVVCLGFRKGMGMGMGLGMIPVFIDSGSLINWRNGSFLFDGIFLKHKFDAKCVSQIEKKSFEKILIFLKTSIHHTNPDVILLVLRDQFYPFKSRSIRDQILQRFPKPQMPQPA